LLALSTFALSQGFSTHFRSWTTMPFEITLWTPVDNQKINQTLKSIYTLHLIHSSMASNEVNCHCSCGCFRHHGLYRLPATKVLLYKEIMWTPSIGHHAPPVEKSCFKWSFFTVVVAPESTPHCGASHAWLRPRVVAPLRLFLQGTYLPLCHSFARSTLPVRSWCSSRTCCNEVLLFMLLRAGALVVFLPLVVT